ncbi:MAG: ABC transporter ATP-binding protein, partial [Acidimicrobiia bacterium]|nr:ABC transporter ATP-binding protein [Acidimicrobiia bacterium]
MSLLDVEDLAVTFNTPDGPVYAVSNVSFSVKKGEALGIVGESGSGKSVTVKSLMGLLPRTADITGTAEFDGVNLFNLPSDRKKHFYGVDVAMVFQNPMTSLNPVKRIGSQLTEGMRYHTGISSSDANARAVELLDLVRIPDASDRLAQYPHELSGGMRQRVVIAMALANDPALLIADEPTTALDVTVQRDILDLLDSLRADLDMGLVLITHDLGVVHDRT